MRAGRSFEAAHIPGAKNVSANGSSGWPRENINSRLSSLHPHVQWQEASLGESGRTDVFGNLAGLLATVGAAPSTNKRHQ